MLWDRVFRDVVGLSPWFLLQEFLSLLESGEILESLEVSGQQCAQHGHLQADEGQGDALLLEVLQELSESHNHGVVYVADMRALQDGVAWRGHFQCPGHHCLAEGINGREVQAAGRLQNKNLPV